MRNQYRKLFVSLPMTGRPEKEVLDEMNMWKEKVERAYCEPFSLLDNYHKKPGMTKAEIVADSIMLMTQADVIFFAPDWHKTRGCKIEHEIAVEYMPDNVVPKKVRLHIIGADLDTLKREIRYDTDASKSTSTRIHID